MLIPIYYLIFKLFDVILEAWLYLKWHLERISASVIGIQIDWTFFMEEV